MPLSGDERELDGKQAFGIEAGQSDAHTIDQRAAAVHCQRMMQAFWMEINRVSHPLE